MAVTSVPHCIDIYFAEELLSLFQLATQVSFNTSCQHPFPSSACLQPLVPMQGAVTITVRYGAQRQQFGPAEGHEIAVLDYSSQQLKLMPMLATCYALHFTAAFLVEQYAQAKRTKEEELVADVHSLSAGQHLSCAMMLGFFSSCMH